MNCTGAKAVLSQIKECCYSILLSSFWAGAGLSLCVYMSFRMSGRRSYGHRFILGRPNILYLNAGYPIIGVFSPSLPFSGWPHSTIHFAIIPFYTLNRLELISKKRLSAHGCVAARRKMLTYYRVCSAFSPIRALPWTLIHIFEMVSIYFIWYDQLCLSYHLFQSAAAPFYGFSNSCRHFLICLTSWLADL